MLNLLNSLNSVIVLACVTKIYYLHKNSCKYTG